MKNFLADFLSPQIPSDIGEISMNWEFPEFVPKPKTKAWYAVVGALLLFFLIYAIWTANFLFAVIIFLSVFIAIFQYFEPRRMVNVVVGEDGIIVDRKFFPYRGLRSFAIVYKPPMLKYLYLDLQKGLGNNLAVPLEDVNPLDLRDVLLNYLKEDLEREDVDFKEVWSTRLNLH
ncbi:MAG: hypothetical protein WCT18_03730 [Patescibacteria group bacterium]